MSLPHVGLDRLKHLGAAIRSLVAVGVVFGLLDWTDSQIATVVLAVETLGALIFATNVEKSKPVVHFIDATDDEHDAAPEREPAIGVPLAPVYGFKHPEDRR